MTADRLSQIVFTCVVAVGGTASISSGWEAPFGSSGGFKCSAVSLAIHHHLAKRKPPIYHKLPFTAACIEFQICNFTAESSNVHYDAGHCADDSLTLLKISTHCWRWFPVRLTSCSAAGTLCS
ncbi:hypothetical protein T02_15609 [Trichinella nativa]|uniref:Uncharacterized protein n=4 Tax=Trichinella TaxID=6333 RepID=A0A0V1LUQ7_9BILA|nr:hypothetical protein T05_13754 [Trichinella murrelli]KRY32707.1 hypothetical protein T01_15451 [Trichinella spiralis]KRY53524.1 hypothetical protein T03_11194 [Trichinella britovi]KRZ63256.1 hypothetical protein T02_15609 [Trichinella nativa]OUC49497.1 hypothetical protein D917_05323 [Trichinella nativa]